MKALVTGGAGFIGSHIVDQLIEKGAEVFVLRSGYRSNKHPDLVNKDATVVGGNLLDYDRLKKATKNIDVVFHCGAVMSHYVELYPDLAFDVNIKGMWYLKKACAENGVRRIIMASSSFVYGDCDSLEPIDEGTLLKPKENFGVTKVAGELILQTTYPYIVPYTILRLFNIYGPRSYPDGVYSQAITTFILKALRKESIEVHDDGKQQLDFLYVKDAARAFIECLKQEAENRIFNVGSGEATAIVDLATQINQLTDNPAGIKFNPKHPAFLKRVQADIWLIKHYTDWKPQYKLAEGLKETVDSFIGYEETVKGWTA